jgi:tRNA threonylcarbamoyladenosine biosynthesis protein TsaE
VKSWDIVSRSAEQTQQLGQFLGECCVGSLAILLEGDLGSGKTCFVQGVARGLDVPSSVPVNSPTYTLMNQYQGRIEVSHFDLYRLGSADELIDLDFDSYLYGAGVAIVEWSGMVEKKGVQGISVQLEYGAQENDRSLNFTALDQTGEMILQQLKEKWKEV